MMMMMMMMMMKLTSPIASAVLVRSHITLSINLSIKRLQSLIIISFYLPTSNILYTSCLYSLDMLSNTILAYPQFPYRCDHQSLGYCPHGANRFTSSLRPPIPGLLPSWCQSLHILVTTTNHRAIALMVPIASHANNHQSLD